MARDYTEKSNRRSRRESTGPVALSEESLAAFNRAEERAARRQARPRDDPAREERRSRRAAAAAEKKKRFDCCLWSIIGFVLLLIIILVPVGVLVIGKHHDTPATRSANGTTTSTSGTGSTSSSSSAGGASTTGLSSISQNSIPTAVKGTYLDPFTWVSTAGFNVTYTPETVGGLSLMGINSTWDNSAQANPNVPPLNEPFPYGKQPFRGVDLGGWFVLEPFITPSLFNYNLNEGIVDEYTLSAKLGADQTAQVMENHYATFITEDDFRQIAEAGLDHVRIPYPYWFVEALPGDTYLPNVGFRYLLRAIEWARKYGLRVNLDLHSVPGNANGWNHSGRLEPIGWLNGTDGQKNADTTLEIHNQLSTFFAQERYKNIIGLYGLVNEPRMTSLPIASVLNWTTVAYEMIQKNGLEAKIVFGDGFLGLQNWQGKLTGMSALVLDVHQYVIFNVGQIAQSHTGKIQFACSGWGTQMTQSIDTATGFGPTMVGEFGQADTDCVPYLNNVGVGSRWEGTLTGVTPSCPVGNICSCTEANAAPSSYSNEYSDFLLMFAQAQMDSFEIGYGWTYWTWLTETSTQWSYKKGLAANILPPVAYNRTWSCADAIPDYGILGLSEAY